MNKLKSFGQAGDTIVEVMVVLAVLGLAIGISYATANRSLLNARQAQENSQATELVQAQVEQLRANAGNVSGDPHYIYQAGKFCFNDSSDIEASTASSCNLGEANRYHITIQWSGAADNTFTAQATWDDVLEAGVQDSVTLAYRIHSQ